MYTQKKQIIENLIKLNKGKFFTAKFIKKNGKERIMNCRTGVKKYTTGKGLNFTPLKYGLLSVYDIHSKGYRFINVYSIKELNILNNKIKF